MKYLLFFVLLFQLSALKAQDADSVLRDPWRHTRAGNEAYKKGNFTDAEKRYERGTNLDTNTVKPAANYNLGNARYRQKKYAEAVRAYSNVEYGNSADTAAKVLHNIGNAMLEQQQYEEAINAYKEALRKNPNDEDTR
ncbi:MAG: tetratricopeptide repeat protein, partial [Bacteroidia bacterium]